MIANNLQVLIVNAMFDTARRECDGRARTCSRARRQRGGAKVRGVMSDGRVPDTDRTRHVTTQCGGYSLAGGAGRRFYWALLVCSTML